jgi:hypothetical protein
MDGMPEFDVEATFGDNYFHFYLPMLDADRNESDTVEIVEILGLQPG